ncbi:MAG: YfhO family protein [Bacteroidales bacterium]|nr:YfhO family protein [Bacteroidales bacterium]
MKLITKQTLYYFLPIIIFIAISFIYFSPILQGKRLQQSDVMNYTGMAKEALDWQEKTGKPVLWTNNMFGGMPTYLTINVAQNNFWKYLHIILTFNAFKPVGMLFLYLLGFYLSMLLLRFPPLLSVFGAIAYAFSSYFIIILEPGHITKAMSIGYLPLIVASVIATYKYKSFIYPIIFAIALNLQLMVNHMQITYYTFLIILVFVIVHFADVIKTKEFIAFIRQSVFLIIGGLIAIGCNATTLLLTNEYGKYSTRGKSELTFDKNNKTNGLDRDYITSWSYGIDETLTLLIPDAKGGASYTNVGENSNTYKYFAERYGSVAAKEIIKNTPTYWGTQPFTSGPVYVGAPVFFLFILGIFYLKNSLKWFVLIITIFSILLSWGKNFPWLTNFFIDYFPAYSKFRTVAMILVIAEFAFPFMAVYFLHEVLKKELNKDKLIKSLKYSTLIVGGILVILGIFSTVFFDFTSPIDATLKQYGYPVDEIISDRISMFKTDTFRSLFFILIVVLFIFLFIKNKIKPAFFIIGISLITLIDLWAVNKRYVHNELFVEKSKIKNPFIPTSVDLAILQDTSYYRVLNLAVNTFNDASTSYYHKSIGGYHGAKMKRYQELIEHHISKNNFKVLNMLNTKYIIYKEKDDKLNYFINDSALGNAWFIKKYRLVENADSEIVALNNFNPAIESIVDKRFKKIVENQKFEYDSTATIKLIYYSPEKLIYNYEAQTPQFTVFSEIYYDKGWNLYVDGKKWEYFRCNYVLRGAILPKGKHKIEFIFEPQTYYIGEKVSLISSFVLLFLSAASTVNLIIRKGKSNIKKSNT